MADYSDVKYSLAREWIQRANSRDISWENIEYGNRKDKEGLQLFLNEQSNNSFWEINIDEWKHLVELEKEEFQFRINAEVNEITTIVSSKDELSDIDVPTLRKSSWVLYKKRLLEVSKFSKESVDEIEKTTIGMLRNLSSDTQGVSAIKGLVVGNVQSGKTANMAALMAMGADHGWNMFIVLSGVINSLRIQTQDRMLKDLTAPGTLSWRGLDQLSANGSPNSESSRLDFSSDSKNRFFAVTLKNHRRLSNLIDWLHENPSKTSQMKIMIIDDESDQASINTGDVNAIDDRKRINELITNLVNNKDKNGNKTKTQFKAMNYIGYTATPYANILNDINEESLFPKDFIVSLGQSKEYFGPQQIFGSENKTNGMNIVRNVYDDELMSMKLVHTGETKAIPEEMEKSLLWFLCASAALRVNGFTKPLSLLIHTSVRIIHHKNVYESILQWLDGKKTKILEDAEELWEIEKVRFTKKDFTNVYPNYGQGFDNIYELPEFSKIKLEILNILEEKTKTIIIDEDNNLQYGQGLHICVDNGGKIETEVENSFIRLAYPDSSIKFEKAPLFIVIGGATLSRGLTIEGLVSTYFLRTTSTADTLMQMGRWFGYRRGYELYPRIWTTHRTQEQFEFLSSLDDQLRETISLMQITNKLPIDVGVKINNTPAVSFLRITAANKMQMATYTDMDYRGMRSQTVVFDSNEEFLSNNLSVAELFLNSLGTPRPMEVFEKNKSNIVFENIKFDSIKEKLLLNYRVSKRSRALSDMESIIEWIEDITEQGLMNDWNVIVAGKGEAKIGEGSNDKKRWSFNNCSIEKVERTERNNSVNDDHLIFGVISGPSDMISDVNPEKYIGNTERELKDILSKPRFTDRDYFGLSQTPQLILYCINKNSNPYPNSTEKKELNAVNDIVGMMINIPGGDVDKGTEYAKSLSIDLSLNKNVEMFSDEGDI